jgi:glucose/arabinose dehydrogenase
MRALLLLLMGTPLFAAQTPFVPVKAFANLDFENPLFLASPPDGSNRLFVVEQGGRIWAFPNDPKTSKRRLVADLSDQIREHHNEEGLLGFAFHPQFKRNGQVFTYYSASKPRRSVVSRWIMNPKREKFVESSEEILLEVKQPWGNHNGGMLAFGPDGYLYISLGDGGSGGDPKNAGQRLDTVLGSILRIDINKKNPGLPYAIPKHNPFVDYGEARPEIWAWGLRNVWRFSFDRKNGTLWAGDVGQNAWEEIDIITRGGNYGWNIREGNHPFRAAGRKVRTIPPVAEHARDEAQSITGGYVYRGRRHKELAGKYVYGDFLSGHIWSLSKGGKPVRIAHSRLISSFGEDQAGEIYWTSFDGAIYTLQKR